MKLDRIVNEATGEIEYSSPNCDKICYKLGKYGAITYECKEFKVTLNDFSCKINGDREKWERVFRC